MLKDKNAVIIGGTGGIGSEIVRLFVRNNAHVSLIYNSDVSMADTLKRELGDRVSCYTADIACEEVLKESLDVIIKERLKIDIIIHSATKQTMNKTIEKTVWSDFQDNINVQLKGFYNVIKTLYPVIVEQSKAINKGVNIKFIVILTEYCLGKPPSGLSGYISAKYGLMGFSKAMVPELARFKCTVNMLSPGMVNTPLISFLPEKFIELSAQNNPLKRIAEARDVAQAALFFASEAADYLNGVNLLINGGNTIA